MKHRNFHLLLLLVIALSFVIGRLPAPASAFALIIWLGAATIYIGGLAAWFVQRVSPVLSSSDTCDKRRRYWPDIAMRRC